jgi:hypothetical protein
MRFRDLGLLPQTEAAEIEGGEKGLGYKPSLEISGGLRETFHKAREKHHYCGGATS